VKEDFLGSIKSKMLERHNELKGALIQQLKTQVPKGGVPPSEQIKALDSLSLMDMMTLRKEVGDEALNNLIFNIEKLRMDGRRKQNGK
jgi:hypothetical protein